MDIDRGQFLMRRTMGGGLVAVVVCVLASACNSLAGIDGLDGEECRTDFDCPELGDCILGVCEDGLCRYRHASEGSACSGKRKCDAKGSCVECLSAADCADPFREICAWDGRCVQCESDVECPMDLLCIHNSCVQCASNDQCEASEQDCREAVCANNECRIALSTEGTKCSIGECSAAGTCVVE